MGRNASLACVFLSLALAGCGDMPNRSGEEVARNLSSMNDQDTYYFKDVGHNSLAEYGTVIKVRDVNIFTPDPASSKPENAAITPGIEYTIVGRSSKLYTIVQYKNATDHVFHAGSHVLVQGSGTYQRVLDASGLPKDIKRPQGVSFDEGDAAK